ncbi:DUF3613 domain-containing protein [Paraburkholderia aromaticivorans]|uniref:DUF3613 domain-containing protein n=1 Tax=Paraburkholderia aromaticivorans TaxID=2026199 RepID=A0A248VMN9_9BURK|nr:DUF3613 domain-containing protein [Paraburkholderia aromaticivorans]ASV99659.1 hypothetical protein CJU94_16825 [Paraburkholderia aromaticivorans]
MKNRIMKRGWRASRPCRWLATAATAGALLGAGVCAMAQTGATAQPEQAAQPAMRADEVGHAARTWLDLQSSNTQAAPALPTLGAEAGLAYRRYMESFKSKIPDLYGSTLNTGNGGSGAMGVNSGLGGSSGSSGSSGGSY